MAKEFGGRFEGNRNQVERAGEDLPKSGAMEEYCYSPMFPHESRGISQVSQLSGIQDWQLPVLKL